MSYEIHNASAWPLERTAPYMSDILAAMQRLAARFPKDISLVSLFGEFLTGQKALWLVLDGDKFVSMAMTQIITIPATGERTAVLCDMAGEDVAHYAADMCAALERWADENNCTTREVVGRTGWRKMLAAHGYEPQIIRYRKRTG